MIGWCILVFLCVFLLISTRIAPKPFDVEAGLNKSENVKFRNLAAFFVLLHHECWRLFDYNTQYGKAAISVFSNIGHVLVACFFAWSGYGIAKSLLKKKNYLKHFIRNSIIPLVLFSLAINVIKVLVSCFFVEPIDGFSMSSLLRKLLFIDLVDQTEWYLIVLCGIYVLIYVVERFFYRFDLYIMLCSIVLYIFSAALLRVEPHWYVSVPAWILGFWIGKTKLDLERMLISKKWFLGVMCLTLLLLGCGVFVSNRNTNYYLQSLVLISAGLVFAFFLFMLSARVSLSRYWSILGDVSLGIYVVHTTLFDLIFANIQESTIAGVVSLVLVFPVSIIVNRCFAWMKRRMYCE